MSVEPTPVRESNVEQTDDAIIHYFSPSEQRGWPIHILVAAALEEVADRPTNEIEPLHHHIDSEALNHLFQPYPNCHPHTEGEVTFPVDEYRVTVTAHKQVVIKEEYPTR